jgi:hypothetical protein
MSEWRSFVSEYRARPENKGLSYAQALVACKGSEEWVKRSQSRVSSEPSVAPLKAPSKGLRASTAIEEEKLTYTENIVETDGATKQKGRMTKKKKLEAEIKANERKLELLRIELDLIEQKRK